MKIRTFIFTGLLMVLGLPLRAQYSIVWSKISGGGGTSGGGNYSVSGTIGQLDAAGALTGGNYSVTGGFWSLYAVQTSGAPLLSISRTSTNTVRIFWPSPATGFILQQNASLNTTNWVVVPQSPVDDGTNVSVVINPPAGNWYFRLKR